MKGSHASINMGSADDLVRGVIGYLKLSGSPRVIILEVHEHDSLIAILETKDVDLEHLEARHVRVWLDLPDECRKLIKASP